MIKLSNKPQGQRWLSLVAGVRVLVRPYDEVTRQAARIRAYEAVSEMADAQTAEREVSGQTAAVHDLSDPVVRQALGQTLMAQGIARQVIAEWEGVTDENGDPVPVTPEWINALMRVPGMADSLLTQYDAAFSVLSPATEAAEGNG